MRVPLDTPSFQAFVFFASDSSAVLEILNFAVASYTVAKPSSYGFLIIKLVYASVWWRKEGFTQSLSETNSLFERYRERVKFLLSGVRIFFHAKVSFQSRTCVFEVKSSVYVNYCASWGGNPSWVIFYSRCILPIKSIKALSLYTDSICLYYQSWKP